MIGTTLQDMNGRAYRVLREISQGGQGVVYEAEESKTRERVVAKLYHPAVATPAMATRLDALIGFQLSTRSPALCAPITRVRGHGVGAIQPFAQGTALESLFENVTYTLQEGLMIAIALTRALTVLERLGIAHADLSANNILVRWANQYHELALIDLDNAVIPGAPAPTFRGQDPYAAPELLVGGQTPSLTSDRFSLATLLHLLLYLRHPFAALPEANKDFASYVELLKQAAWIEDPMMARVAAPTNGRPVGALSRELQGLFRAALQVDPSRRPTAETWTRALEAALDNTFECDHCKNLFVNDPARVSCPWCAATAPGFALHVNGRHLSLSGMYTTIGRAEVGGNPTVSREHVLFRRCGFALVAKCLSANGLAIQIDRGWVEVAAGHEVVLTPGTWLRFARGVEGLVCEQQTHGQ